jgi:hypothetical protein
MNVDAHEKREAFFPTTPIHNSSASTLTARRSKTSHSHDSPDWRFLTLNPHLSISSHLRPFAPIRG